MIISIAGGVGGEEVGGIKLEATPMMTMMMTLTVPTDHDW